MPRLLDCESVGARVRGMEIGSGGEVTVGFGAVVTRQSVGNGGEGGSKGGKRISKSGLHGGYGCEGRKSKVWCLWYRSLRDFRDSRRRRHGTRTGGSGVRGRRRRGKARTKRGRYKLALDVQTCENSISLAGTRRSTRALRSRPRTGGARPRAKEAWRVCTWLAISRTKKASRPTTHRPLTQGGPM